MESVGRVGGWLGALCGAVMLVAGALADEADRAEAYRDSGDTHRAMGRPTRALADYESAIALAPDARAYFGRAMIFAASRRLDAALADFDAAIVAAPDFADAYFQRGRTYHRLGQNQRSHADHATAIRLDPDHAWAYGFDYRHGLLYERRLAEHRAALRLAPDNAKAFYNRALRLSAEISKFYRERHEQHTPFSDLLRFGSGRSFVRETSDLFVELFGDRVSVTVQGLRDDGATVDDIDYDYGGSEGDFTLDQIYKISFRLKILGY